MNFVTDFLSSQTWNSETLLDILNVNDFVKENLLSSFWFCQNLDQTKTLK